MNQKLRDKKDIAPLNFVTPITRKKQPRIIRKAVMAILAIFVITFATGIVAGYFANDDIKQLLLDISNPVTLELEQ